MPHLTTPFEVTLPTIEAFQLFSGLDFVPVDQMGERTGPFVYAHVIEGGGIVYVGKNEATTGPVGGRPKSYATWAAGYQSEVEAAGKPDPMDDIVNGELALLRWSPIVRFASRHKPVVYVASVIGSDHSSREWEARLQALSGVLTGNESLIGGSGWEPGTNRYAGYQWAKQRVLELRDAQAL